MLEIEKHDKEEVTISFLKANLLGIFCGLLPVFVLGSIYYLVWGYSEINRTNSIKIISGSWGYLILLTIIALGVVFHELIHGLTWARFATNGVKSVKYGISWKFLTPYCHCAEPLQLKHYMTGAMMPSIVLGFIPSIIAIFLGDFNVLAFGLFFTLAAGGDFMVMNALRKERNEILVQDHPTKIGYIVFRKNT
ncbi:MAG: DUF3267 domain-containing protein [Cytophagales bacterium]|jgi:hypothetical protein|nr:DUF3267 domain-containing protein [Cytophagales bacterium]